MKKVFALLWLLAVAVAMCQVAHAQQLTPEWLRFLGDGSSGTYSCTSGTCALGDERWFSSFTVSAGATVVSLANNGPFVVRSTGTCTVAGTISNSVNTGNGGGVLNEGDLGGAGGGGGGGAVAGSAGLNSVGDGNVVIVAAGAKGAAGQNGGNAASPTLSQYRTLISGGTYWAVGGSTGGAGGGNGAGVAGGKGGNGGGPVILVCNTINFTGTIDASGAPGQPAPANSTGSGGGGGGGYVILSAVNYTANSGTINTAGGAGGSCGSFTNCGSGGSGGNGWSVAITIK
jgi:hypothetical protein